MVEECIRKVEALGGRAREKAKEMGLDDNDLVLVETKIHEDELPEYELTLIEGSPTEFIKKKFLKEEADENG